MIRAAVETVLECYPAIFFACHRTHVRDKNTKRALSSHQAAVLDHLDAVEPTHLHELAAHLDVTPSSMSLMIDRLERSGFVRRSRDSVDARRINLRLTGAGARIKDQQKILDPSLVEAMLRLLPTGEREAALHGLRLLAQAAGELLAAGDAKRLRKDLAS
jgi:MarR family transcriptional regulator, organic hydroperoxide resistance regulator